MRDIDVRNAIKRQVLVVHSDDPDTRILDELAVASGLTRVDIAVVNGSLHGYEIKSDSDTLERLPLQQCLFNNAFDFVTIVCGMRHMSQIAETVPYWWGIMCAVDTRGSISVHNRRDSQRNPSKDPVTTARFLWKDELLLLLQSQGIIKGLQNRTREWLIQRVSTAVDIDLLSGFVRDRLKSREAWRSGISPFPNGGLSLPSSKL